MGEGVNRKYQAITWKSCGRRLFLELVFDLQSEDFCDTVTHALLNKNWKTIGIWVPRVLLSIKNCIKIAGKLQNVWFVFLFVNQKQLFCLFCIFFRQASIRFAMNVANFFLLSSENVNHKTFFHPYLRQTVSKLSNQNRNQEELLFLISVWFFWSISRKRVKVKKEVEACFSRFRFEIGRLHNFCLGHLAVGQLCGRGPAACSRKIMKKIGAIARPQTDWRKIWKWYEAMGKKLAQKWPRGPRWPKKERLVFLLFVFFRREVWMRAFTLVFFPLSIFFPPLFSLFFSFRILTSVVFFWLMSCLIFAQQNFWKWYDGKSATNFCKTNDQKTGSLYFIQFFHFFSQSFSKFDEIFEIFLKASLIFRLIWIWKMDWIRAWFVGTPPLDFITAKWPAKDAKWENFSLKSKSEERILIFSGIFSPHDPEADSLRVQNGIG